MGDLPYIQVQPGMTIRQLAKSVGTDTETMKKVLTQCYPGTVETWLHYETVCTYEDCETYPTGGSSLHLRVRDDKNYSIIFNRARLAASADAIRRAHGKQTAPTAPGTEGTGDDSVCRDLGSAVNPNEGREFRIKIRVGSEKSPEIISAKAKVVAYIPSDGTEQPAYYLLHVLGGKQAGRVLEGGQKVYDSKGNTLAVIGLENQMRDVEERMFRIIERSPDKMGDGFLLDLIKHESGNP